MQFQWLSQMEEVFRMKLVYHNQQFQFQAQKPLAKTLMKGEEREQ